MFHRKSVSTKYRTDKVLHFLQDYISKNQDRGFLKINVDGLLNAKTMENAKKILGDENFNRIVFSAFNIYDSRGSRGRAIQEVIKNDLKIAEKYIDDFIVKTVTTKNVEDFKDIYPTSEKYKHYYQLKHKKQYEKIKSHSSDKSEYLMKLLKEYAIKTKNKLYIKHFNNAENLEDLKKNMGNLFEIFIRAAFNVYSKCNLTLNNINKIIKKNYQGINQYIDENIIKLVEKYNFNLKRPNLEKEDVIAGYKNDFKTMMKRITTERERRSKQSKNTTSNHNQTILQFLRELNKNPETETAIPPPPTKRKIRRTEKEQRRMEKKIKADEDFVKSVFK